MDRQQLFEDQQEATVKILNFLSIRNRNPRTYGTDDLLYTSEADLIDMIGKSENISASDIAKTLGITKSAVSKTVRKLGKKELVRQIPDVSDNRKMLLKLTAKGTIIYDHHKRIDDTGIAFVQSALRDCSKEEIRSYIKIANIHIKALYEIISNLS